MGPKMINIRNKIVYNPLNRLADGISSRYGDTAYEALLRVIFGTRYPKAVRAQRNIGLLIMRFGFGMDGTLL